MKKEIKKVKGYISVTEEMKTLYLKEEFKGQVTDIPIRFPKDLGTEHPFKFEDAENVFKKVGLINGIINKFADNIIGEFSVKVKNPNSQGIIDGLTHDASFKPTIREWVVEGLSKGSGFIDLTALQENKIKCLNANNMYIKRDTKGNVKKFNQYLGNITTFNPESRKLTPFEPNEIAYLPINRISGEAYGMGLIIPNERVIENLVGGEQNYHKLLERKAGAPIHAKLGQPGEAVDPLDVDAMANNLKFMNNRTEWATDGNVEFKLIDFGLLGDSLTKGLEYDFHQLIAGMQTPEVLLGSGQLNEGIGNVQQEGLQRTIAALQDEIEGIIEEKILRPLLNANDLDETIEFVWNLPSETEINNRIDRISKLLESFNISENMKRMLQLELAKLLNIEGAEEFLIEPEVGVDEEEVDMEKAVQKANLDGRKAETAKKESPEAKKESKIPQPEVPGAKPGAKESIDICTDMSMVSTHIHEQDAMIRSGDISVREFINLKEIKGFNYSDYLIAILKRLRIDKFEDLAAMNESDIEMGLLDENDIKKLRIILKNGFRRNKSIRQIENEVKNNISLKDRFDEEGKLQLTANERPSIITRTETVRIANTGLLDTFKDNGIKKVRWLAALSERTCPECESMNAQVFQLNESYGKIPLHPNCRCSFISVD